MFACSCAFFVNLGTLAVIAMRSPLFWAGAQTLAIPLSVIFDVAFWQRYPTPIGLLGDALILAAFYALTFSSSKPKSEDEQGLRAEVDMTPESSVGGETEV